MMSPRLLKQKIKIKRVNVKTNTKKVEKDHQDDSKRVASSSSSEFEVYNACSSSISSSQSLFSSFFHAWGTFRRLDIMTLGHYDAWTFRRLDIMTLGHYDAWTFRRLDISTLGHYDAWTF
ncbi:hypothetical protein niasHT_024286 [Heterodera trifolii]|uniref:Uncharacterized protein n=1 Tax=Heterodera trifolii TaxID=157864 RepID=A0ABD2JMI8_9BILA